MSALDPLAHPVVEPSLTRNDSRPGAANAEWLRQLERAQWAALGEGLDRSSPTSAAELRPGSSRDLSLRQQHDGQPQAAHASAASAGNGAKPAGHAVAPVVGAQSHDVAQAHGASAPQGPHASAAVEKMPLVPRDGPHDRAAVAKAGGRAAGTASFKAAIVAAAGMAATEGATGPEDSAVPLPPAAGMPDEAALEAAGAEAVEPDATPHAEPPAARAMHVFHDQQDAHVFVRDARLDPRAAHALVARIAAELALGGTRLATVTLNGRTIYEAPARPQAARERDSESNANQEGR